MRFALRLDSSFSKTFRGAVAATSVLGLGALLGAAGCSDPVPPTPQGAFQATFLSNTAQCGIAGHNAQIGSVTNSTKDKVLVSGTESAEVECTVSGTSTFSVLARITQSGQGLEINIPALTSGATKDNPAKGSVNFESIKTSGTSFTSPKDTPCDFFFDTKSQGVASGRVWISFNCPKVVQGTMKTCALGPGFAIFENCGE